MAPDSEGEYQISFSVRRGEWLASQWPAIPAWGGAAAILLAGIVFLCSFSLWFLILLLPWWIWAGSRIAGVLWFLASGKSRCMLIISEHAIGVSGDEGETIAPVGYPNLQEEKNVWVLWGNFGAMNIVIPKRAVSESEIARLRESADRVLAFQRQRDADAAVAQPKI